MQSFFKSATRAALLLFVVVFCTACPYDSYYPLSGDTVEYTRHLLGTFYNGSYKLQLNAKDAQTFYFTHSDIDGSDADSGTGQLIKINDINFAVLKNSATGKYYTYKVIDIGSKSITVCELKDSGKIESEYFNSANEFKRFVLNNADAFSEPIKWVER